MPATCLGSRSISRMSTVPGSPRPDRCRICNIPSTAILSNYVQYMGVRGPDGAYFPFTSCKQWRMAVIDGRYSYIKIRPHRGGLTWPRKHRLSGHGRGRGTTLILQGTTRAGNPFHGYVGYVLYRVDPGFSASACKTA